MTDNVSAGSFNCPTCGAPLQPEVGTRTMKCSYCGGTAKPKERVRPS